MSEPRYGIWAPVGGNFGPLNSPEEPFDASYERSRSLVKQAERFGFATTLVAQHLANPRSLELEQLETWTACAALAEATDRIEIIAAIKPLLFHPAVLAKMALGIDAISQGRFAINLVSAWYRPEMERTNIPFPPHDERYRYSGEWLRIVKSLWSGERVHFQGEYFKIEDLSFRPTPIAQPHPRVYLGGASEAAQILAAREADVYFINGQPIEDVRKVIAETSSRPRSPRDSLGGTRQIGDDGAHAQATRDRVLALSGRDPIDDIQQQVQNHWDYMGDLPHRNWLGFMAFELHYELHIVAMLLVNSRTTKINDPVTASFAAQRILPDEAVHRLGVIAWWQRKYDRASPGEKAELAAQLLELDEEGQRRRNAYLKEHWQINHRATGSEIKGLDVIYDAWRREVLSYLLDIPISSLPQLVSVSQ